MRTGSGTKLHSSMPRSTKVNIGRLDSLQERSVLGDEVVVFFLAAQRESEEIQKGTKSSPKKKRE